MLLPALALVAAGGCVVASFRRLWFAAAPTTLDLGVLEAALRPGKGGGLPTVAALGRALEREVGEGGDLAIERGLLVQDSDAGVEARVTLLNEQLQELDWRVQRWARVPRVCASIASSAGLLLATLALRQGLAISAELPIELQQEGLYAALFDALNVAAIGLAGTAFCIAIQRRARSMAKEQGEVADRLVDRLEALVSGRGRGAGEGSRAGVENASEEKAPEATSGLA